MYNKKNEIMPFAPTWMDLENIKLSEISQLAYLRNKDSSKYIQNRHRLRFRKQASGNQSSGEGKEEGQIRGMRLANYYV